MSIITPDEAELIPTAVYVPSDIADVESLIFDNMNEAVAYAHEIGSNSVVHYETGFPVDPLYLGDFGSEISAALASVGVTPKHFSASTYRVPLDEGSLLVTGNLSGVTIALFHNLRGREHCVLAEVQLSRGLVNAGTIAMMIDHIATNEFAECAA